MTKSGHFERQSTPHLYRVHFRGAADPIQGPSQRKWSLLDRPTLKEVPRMAHLFLTNKARHSEIVTRVMALGLGKVHPNNFRGK